MVLVSLEGREIERVEKNDGELRLCLTCGRKVTVTGSTTFYKPHRKDEGGLVVPNLIFVSHVDFGSPISKLCSASGKSVAESNVKVFKTTKIKDIRKKR